MDKFTNDEVATIRKFLAWLQDGEWLENKYSTSEGVTGVSDEGITVSQFSAVSDYDSYTLETDDTFIPWLALTDPEEYQRQCDAEEAERERQYELQRQESARQHEARERALLDALKSKYEKQPPEPERPE